MIDEVTLQSDELAAGLQTGRRSAEVWCDGYIVHDTGSTIYTYQVNVPGPGCEPPNEGWPLYLPVLVKVCERQYLIDDCMTVQLSRPSAFRGSGESLMSDPEDAQVSRAWMIEEQQNDPTEMARAHLLDVEANRAAELIDARITTTTREITTRKSRRNVEDRGNKAWLWCSAIMPTDDDQWERLRSSLPSTHDHYWTLHNPRMFAHALGSIVVDQFGARGSETKLRHEHHAEVTHHPGQMVIHGPVVYVKDPYRYVAESATPMERLVRPMFTKRLEYEDQREYRFVVWDESEPAETVMLLNASSALLETARGLPSGPVPTVLSVPQPRTPPPSPPPLPIRTTKPRELIGDMFDILDMMDDPHIKHRVRTIDREQAPADLDEKTAIYPAVQDMRRIVGKTRNTPEAAAAAWHAEPFIRCLCATFQDPIESIRLTPDNFIVIEVKFPEGSEPYGRIAIGPRGVARYKIGKDSQYTITSHRDSSPLGWPILVGLEDTLSEFGLPRLGDSTA